MERTHLRRDKFWTFDIETTTIITDVVKGKPIRQGFIWSGQFYDGIDYIQVRSLQDVIKRLQIIADDNKDESPYKIVVFVHNLSYEFQFIKDFFNFTKILCTDKRKIISAETDQIVFRCSYFLSNMSLEKFMQFEGVPEEYQKSNMDYLKIRYPWTKISEDEYIYCKNDVVGLHMAVQHRIDDCTNSDINNLPLTSTGYVRKACRKAVTSNKGNRYRFIRERLDKETFLMLHAAFRGGNTHANKMYANKINKNVGQRDITSSYPFELLTKPYPAKFFDLEPFTQKEFDYYISHSAKWATIFEVAFTNLRLKKPDATPVPYISTSKCDRLQFLTPEEIEANKNNKEKKLSEKSARRGKVDNGRILSCHGCSMIITEIDFNIIKNQYKWDDIKIIRAKVAKKKMLCKELRDQIMKFYFNKTTLKQDESDPNFDEDKAYQYAKSKNMLNGIYGMHVTNPCKSDYIFDERTKAILEGYLDDDGNFHEGKADEQLLLDRYYSSYSNFLSYQVGVYCTAYARASLQKALDACINKSDPEHKSDVIYCDTDSVKFLNPKEHEADFEKINQEKIKLAEKYNAYVDFKGKRYYLGVFTDEGIANKFKTFGAKKYMYRLKDKKDIKLTISGVNKKKGKEKIKDDCRRNKIASPFEIEKGYVFHGIKTTSCYNDLSEIKYYEIDNHKIMYASNIAMYPNSYTLGLSGDYDYLLQKYAEKMEVYYD